MSLTEFFEFLKFFFKFSMTHINLGLHFCICKKAVTTNNLTVLPGSPIRASIR